MRRILLGLVLLSLACKASSGGSQDVVLVNVDAPNLTGITHLNVTFTNAGTSETRSYPANATSTPIVFPTTLSATVPTSRSGSINVSVDGLNAQNLTVAHGQASKDLVIGGETDITVNLAAVTMGPDAGAGGQGGAPATGGGTAGAGGGAGGVIGGATSAGGGTGGAGGAGGVKGGTTSAGGGTGGAGGAGGVKGGTTGAGGSAGTGATGGSTGSGGSSGVCTPGLIDDMEEILGGWLPACEGRIGHWQTFNDGDPNTVQTPVPGQVVPYVTPGADGSAHSIRTFGKCAPFDPVARTQWGASIGFDLDNPGGTKLGYNASGRGYRGLRFWARLGETTRASATVSVIFSDINTDPSGGKCSGSGCYDNYYTSITLAPAWSQYTIYWTQLTRGGWGVPFLPFASDGIVNISWQFASGTTFDMCVDDVAFVTEMPGADAGVDAAGGAGGKAGTDAGAAGSGGAGAGGTATNGSSGGIGGVGGVGGSSSTAAGGSTVTCSPPKSTGGFACPGNYCTVGMYSGYDFTYTDLTGKSSICMAPNSLCVAGTTGAWNPPAGTVWGVGFGVNLSPFSTPVQLSGTGVTVALTGLPAGVGVTVGVAGYCAVITAATQTIPWTSFNTICSGLATGVALTGAPNTPTIQFNVSSGSTVGTFDFCVTALSFQ
jgi:hypothetical protein